MTTALDLPRPPTERQMNRLVSATAPFARVTQPLVLGMDNVPDRGALLVGNHTLFGLLDLPFMMAELWTQRGIVTRGLGDHGHYAIPVWRDLLERAGMVRGTRENARALMRDGQNVLVFPGGGGEVFKSRGEKYQLKWKERLGFARLAIEFGYPIVPFAAIGVEDMFDVVADDKSPGLAQVSALMKRLVGIPLPPIARGIGATPLPRPQRLYFWFGEPIETDRFDGRSEDDDAARALRDEVKAAVEQGLDTLMAEREHDPKRGLLPRLQIGPGPGGLDDDPDATFVRRAFDAWNESGAEGAAAWISRWAQLVDPPQRPGSATWRGREAVLARLEQVAAELGATSVELTEARSGRDEVLVEFAVHAGDGAADSCFFALVELEAGQEAGQITKMRVFFERDEALNARR